MSENGKIISGGTKYLTEVKGLLGVLGELDKMNKLVRLSNREVDALADKLKRVEPSARFNDPHLVAMVVLSRCCVVCTDEKEAIPFLKRKDFYPKGVKPPSIYRNESHKHLCCKGNVVGRCND